jgi:hypothetical protein
MRVLQALVEERERGGLLALHPRAAAALDDAAPIMAVRRDRCGAPIGGADDATLLALSRLLAFVVGAAD